MKIGQTQSFPFSDDFFNFLLHNKQSLTSDKKERESAQKHVINYIKKKLWKVVYRLEINCPMNMT